MAPQHKIIVGMERQFRTKVRTSLLQRAARSALELAMPRQGKDSVELSIYVTDATEMASLNKKYRKKDSPTDVLSFSFLEKKRTVDAAFIFPSASVFLGEVVLCYPYIRSQAEREKQPLNQALAWAAVHGVLHLLGRSHYRKKEKLAMHSEEESALKLMNLQGRKES